MPSPGRAVDLVTAEAVTAAAAAARDLPYRYDLDAWGNSKLQARAALEAAASLIAAEAERRQAERVAGLEAENARLRDQFPRGPLSSTDEGALRMRTAVKKNTFIIDFGKPVAWLGLGAHEAKDLAARLLAFAKGAS